jgi:hypothetical protein
MRVHVIIGEPVAVARLRIGVEYCRIIIHDGLSAIVARVIALVCGITRLDEFVQSGGHLLFDISVSRLQAGL